MYGGNIHREPSTVFDEKGLGLACWTASEVGERGEDGGAEERTWAQRQVCGLFFDGSGVDDARNLRRNEAAGWDHGLAA
eukprot:396796-Pleurochrysis_carterae.AAC.1